MKTTVITIGYLVAMSAAWMIMLSGMVIGSVDHFAKEWGWIVVFGLWVGKKWFDQYRDSVSQVRVVDGHTDAIKSLRESHNELTSELAEQSRLMSLLKQELEHSRGGNGNKQSPGS